MKGSEKISEPCQPLLSIAIPTWNRAELLSEALACLEAQISDFKDDIELVISDNASTDNTQEVINGFIGYNLDVKVITYKQAENIGYYGNFKKARELSQGKFFWLLSDDDHVQDGIIEIIIERIRNTMDLGLIFLDVWDKNEYDNGICLQDFESVYSLLEQSGYKLTLISTIIFLNIKQKDKDLFNTYNRNSFIGFLLFLNTAEHLGKAVSIKGPSLKVSMGVVSFNVYDSWIEDMSDCVSFMNELGMPLNVVNSFVNSYLKNVIKKHYLNSRLKGYQVKNKKELRSIEQRLRSYYSGYEEFYPSIEKNIRRNYFILYMLHRDVLRRIKDKLGRIVKSISTTDPNCY